MKSSNATGMIDELHNESIEDLMNAVKGSRKHVAPSDGFIAEIFEERRKISKNNIVLVHENTNKRTTAS